MSGDGKENKYHHHLSHDAMHR